MHIESVQDGSEWIEFKPQTVGRIGDEPFQAINCTDIDNQAVNNQQLRKESKK